LKYLYVFLTLTSRGEKDQDKVMALKKQILISVLLLFPMVSSLSQNGAPLLTHYIDNREMENQFGAICQDKNNVMMFANRRGIITFDGQNKGYISIPTIPYTIAYNSFRKRVFVGGENNYGYLVRNEKGIYNFMSLLTEGTNVGPITKIIFTDSTVYFYGEQSISRHNLTTGTLEMRLFQKDNKPFSGMFTTGKNTFINVLSQGLYRLESDTLFPIVTGYLLQNEEILFSLPYDGKMVLLGLGNSNLSLFDGIKFYVYPVRDDNYLKQNTLSNGISISDSLYAFSTLDGGAIVVAARSGVVRKTINYQRGLPDDEIFAIGTDNSNGLWLSHQFGLTRAEMMLPVGNFSMYKGLMGNLISTLWHKNELFVATSEGIFYLSQVKDFTEEEVLVRKVPTIGRAFETKPVELSADMLKKPADKEAQTSRKSVFSRIFGKKESNIAVQEVKQEEKPEQQPVIPEVVKSPEPEYIRRTISRLKSVNYVFLKVEGLDEKCKQMVSTGSGILASTNKGLYVINDHAAKSLVGERYIYSISSISTDNKYYVATSDGYFYVTHGARGWIAGFPDNDFIKPVYSVVPSDNGILWAGADDEAIRITPGDKPAYRSYKMDSDFPLRYITNYENDTLFVFSTSGVGYYDKNSDSLRQYFTEFKTSGIRLEYVISQPEAPWIKQGDNWICLSNEGKVSEIDRAILKIFDNIISIVHQGNYLWVITGENQIFRVVLNSLTGFKSDLDLFIRSIRNEKGEYFAFSDIVIEPGDNFVNFDIVAPDYIKKNSIQYQYIIDKISETWTPWSSSSFIPVPFKYGTYTIRVRAKDIWGNISEIKPLTYTRKAPFTKTRLFYVLLVAVALYLITMIVWFREKQLKKEKHILEEKVKERTSEIEAQKEEITSSIEYASRIQLAMLPEKDHFSELFPDHFIFFKPRDIVSGDFYWIGENDNHIFLTVADCTGHGVPGAFMSTLGVASLNEIITNKMHLHANTVLNLLREKIKISLHQTGKEGEAADGMDVSFCILHKNRRSLEFSGAFNPLIIIQKGVIKEYKGDRMPIGIYRGEKESFTNYEINVSSGDTVYLFSDGMTDQFGGPYGAKYKRATLKKLLWEINSKPMDEQKKAIEDEFTRWKGNGEQIDDITIIGVRI
jgi:serine phosphatase RsbU (regulator of sigma subunit)